jgi:hypothetical protein
MRLRLFLAVFPLLLACAAPACARGSETLDSLLPGIRAAHPGRLSDAEPWRDSEGRTHYRIKWMTPEGRILYFDADTHTGRYSNSGGDDGSQWGRGAHGDEGGDGPEDRRHWNDDDRGDDGRGGGDWRGHHGDGDWRGGHNGGDNGGHNGGGGHHHHGN